MIARDTACGLKAARGLALAAAALLLAGCTGLQTLQSAATATDLYALTPKSTYPEDLPKVGQQIVVETPTASASVNSDRIAVMPNAYLVQYLPGARWVDRAPLMVQTLLVESFENSGRVAAVGRSAVGLRADYSLVSELREFQARVPEGAPPGTPVEAWVRLNVKVVDATTDRIVGSISFEKTERAASDATLDIVRAFDAALGGAIKQAVIWSVEAIDRLGPPQRSF